eukprot:6186657-Pleurochrysis_carterae.AAC.1
MVSYPSTWRHKAVWEHSQCTAHGLPRPGSHDGVGSRAERPWACRFKRARRSRVRAPTLVGGRGAGAVLARPRPTEAGGARSRSSMLSLTHARPRTLAHARSFTHARSRALHNYMFEAAVSPTRHTPCAIVRRRECELTAEPALVFLDLLLSSPFCRGSHSNSRVNLACTTSLAPRNLSLAFVLTRTPADTHRHSPSYAHAHALTDHHPRPFPTCTANPMPTHTPLPA